MILGDIFGKYGISSEQVNEGSVTTSPVPNYSYKKPGRISSILSTLSRYGMSYEDQVFKNMKAIPADKLLQPKDDSNFMLSSMYGNLDWKFKPEEEKSFHEKTLDSRRKILRKLASQPDIEDILDIMADECVVYDDEESYICNPFIDDAILQDLNENTFSEVRTAIDTIFYRMYLLTDWKNSAWAHFRRWLIDGDIAYEIVYDDLTNPHLIIGIIDIDPATLTRVVDNGITYWIQFKDVVGKERRLLDAQVIYIKYEDSDVIERQSYLERLIRPFNVYRIVEQAQIIWTVTQSSFKTIFTIPVQGMSRARGLQTLTAAMNRYKEDISFDSDTGELKVNGKMMLPFTREYFMPENENGRPQMETLTDQGPSLMDNEQLRYFEDKLYRMSKIPSSRFDRDNPSTWFGSDPSSQLRDEIKFSRFISRLQHQFAEIILKPMRIQLSLQMPDLKNDKRILNAIGVRFNSYNQFVELMEQQIDMTRMEHIQTLRDTFVTMDEEGNEEHYFCDDFLIMKYLKMSNADLELNAKLKKLAAEKKKKEADEGEGGGSEEEEMDDELGLEGEGEEGSGEGNEESNTDEEQPEEESGNEIDKEMEGDVQPEGSETTQA